MLFVDSMKTCRCIEIKLVHLELLWKQSADCMWNQKWIYIHFWLAYVMWTIHKFCTFLQIDLHILIKSQWRTGNEFHIALHALLWEENI